MIPLVLLLFYGALVLILYRLVTVTVSRVSHSLKARRLSCDSPAAFPQSPWDFLGVGQLRDALRANENMTFMPYQVSRYRKISAIQGRETPTFTYHMLNSKFLFTSDPENIQAILATQFNDFDLGKNRRGNFASLQGPGIVSQSEYISDSVLGRRRKADSRMME